MTLHKRIRPFNTKKTYPEQKLDNDLSKGIVALGTTVFLRGQVAQDLDNRVSLHKEDAAKQTKKAMQNIAEIPRCLEWRSPHPQSVLDLVAHTPAQALEQWQLRTSQTRIGLH